MTQKQGQHMKKAAFLTRGDLKRYKYDDFLLMELELIEPSLFFSMAPHSPDRFAQALDQRVGS